MGRKELGAIREKYQVVGDGEGAHSSRSSLTHSRLRSLIHAHERMLAVTEEGADGFLAYERRAGIPIIAGDPVCPANEAPRLLRALRETILLSDCIVSVFNSPP